MTQHTVRFWYEDPTFGDGPLDLLRAAGAHVKVTLTGGDESGHHHHVEAEWRADNGAAEEAWQSLLEGEFRGRFELISDSSPRESP